MDFRDFQFRRNDDSTTNFLLGAATGLFLGAIAMFVFDPQQGRRRRALARDKAMHYGNQVSDYVSGVARQTEGLVREKLGSEVPESARPL